MLNLDVLAQEITRAQTVQSSAITLLKKLAGELERISAEMTVLANQSPPQFDAAPLNDLIDKLKTSTDLLASAVSDSTNVVPVKEVILNSEDPTTPTVQVIIPEILPENVVVTAETVVETVDATSSEPQVVITVEAAPVNAETVASDLPVIETAEGQVNVNVDVTPESATVAENVGIDVVETVKEAVAEAEVPAEQQQ